MKGGEKCVAGKALTVIWTPALRQETVGTGVDGSGNSGWRIRQQTEAWLGGLNLEIVVGHNKGRMEAVA